MKRGARVYSVDVNRLTSPGDTFRADGAPPQSGATTKPGVAKRTPGGGTEGEEPQRGSTIDAARSDGANGEVIRAKRVVLFNPVGVGGLNVTGSWGARARPQALMWHAAGVKL